MCLSNGVRMHDGARALAEILEKFLEGRRVDVRPTRASILWDFFWSVTVVRLRKKRDFHFAITAFHKQILTF